VILFTAQNKKMDCCLVDFSRGNKNVSIKEFKDKSFLSQFSTHSSFLDGTFTKDSESLLYFNQEWRFDLKLAALTDNGLAIEKQVEFIQPNPVCNPKYYEFTRLVEGKFFEANASSLLVIMSNCKDADFNGSTCRELEDLPSMPSGFMFYQYQKEKNEP